MVAMLNVDAGGGDRLWVLRGQHQVQAGLSLSGVGAKGEQFLELVDHDDCGPALVARSHHGCDGGQRPWAGGEDAESRRRGGWLPRFAGLSVLVGA